MLESSLTARSYAHYVPAFDSFSFYNSEGTIELAASCSLLLQRRNTPAHNKYAPHTHEVCARPGLGDEQPCRSRQASTRSPNTEPPKPETGATAAPEHLAAPHGSNPRTPR